MNDCRPVFVRARLFERFLQGGAAVGPQRAASHASGDHLVVDGNVLRPRAVRKVEFHGKIFEAAPLLEVPDALISAVIEHDHRERQTLLDCGHQFLAGHEERGIADKDNNLPLGHGQSGSQSCGDFESHGGVSVLHKIPLALRVFVFPQPVQVTGEASGGIDDDGPIACVTVDDIDGCGLIDGHSVARQPAIGRLHPFRQ